MSGEVIKLTLKALPADSPTAIRLRHLLKAAQRGLRLKCLKVEDVPAFPDGPADRSDRITDPGAITGETPKEKNP
jgi:hypothetical protein